MLSALGATERNVRLVMTTSGAAVGVTATMIGALLGFGAWFAYVPSLETDTAHRIDPLNLPWWHQGRPGRPGRRHPVHAPRSGQRTQHAAHLRRSG
jgi:hypothetical protein